MTTIKELLSSVKVEECAPKSNKILVLSSEDTVPDALKKLIEMNIVSAPVIDEKSKEFLGLLDVVDILAFVVSIFDNHSHEHEHEGNLFKSLTASEKYSKQPIGEITNIMQNTVTPVKVGTSLLEVLDIFLAGAHRVPVITEEGKLISILTQVLFFLTFNL
jgi:CBS domain-containing protein